MSNIISLDDIRKIRAAKDQQVEAERLMEVADAIDAILIEHLNRGDLDAGDLAGVLAHRLGTLLKNVTHRDLLLSICERVLRKQAASSDR